MGGPPTPPPSPGYPPPNQPYYPPPQYPGYPQNPPPAQPPAGGGWPPPQQPPPQWGQPQPPYRPPMQMPAWLNVGNLLLIVGGLLIAVGWFVIGAEYNSYTCTSSLTGASCTSNVPTGFYILGVGTLIALVGWILRQMMAARSGPHSP